jgi:hypothetical protein
MSFGAPGEREIPARGQGIGKFWARSGARWAAHLFTTSPSKVHPLIRTLHPSPPHANGAPPYLSSNISLNSAARFAAASRRSTLR